ncbi:MAG: hypothetical protein RLZZ142_1504 [Verrucomicrobiota bacterium]
MKEIGKILAYLGAVLLGGALVAPWLWWGAQSVMDAGYFVEFRRFGFQKYLNRGVLLCALAFLWPAVRWLRVGRLAELSLHRDPRPWRHGLLGLGLGMAAMGLLAGGYLWGGVWHVRGGWRWDALGQAAASAVAVGFLEECLFRGGIQGLFRRSLRPGPALWASTLLFAGVHFIKPDPSASVGTIRWSSGLELLPHSFHQFAELPLLAGGMATLTVFGLLLGWAKERTGALWMSMGLHAGVVFVKLGFEKHCAPAAPRLPWWGAELQVGLCPVLLLLLTLLAVHRLTRPASDPHALL